jgi:hypothetical protein
MSNYPWDQYLDAKLSQLNEGHVEELSDKSKVSSKIWFLYSFYIKCEKY